MQRLFVGIELPESARQILAGVRLSYMNSHWPSARWHAPSALHVTLSFIGQVDKHTATQMAAALVGLSDRGVALSIQGVGYFGTEQKLFVLWAGVEPNPFLLRLQQEVEQRLLPLGLVLDNRPCRPHVTLARVRQGGEMLQGFLARHADLVLLPFAVEHICLYVSSGNDTDVRYEVIERFKLLKR